MKSSISAMCMTCTARVSEEYETQEGSILPTARLVQRMKALGWKVLEVDASPDERGVTRRPYPVDICPQCIADVAKLAKVTP